MQWFKNWFKRRAVVPLSAVPLVPPWNREDRAILNTFLSNPTGRNLVVRARALEAKVAIDACKDVMTPVHSAGRAAGFSDAIDWLISLSISSSEADVESFRPEAAEGETLNLETTSP